jgi:lipoprotein-anchoring transpeptidase ErfK/SrfK
MSSSLRAIAVASCTAVIVTGAVTVATSAGAVSAPTPAAFSVKPAFGVAGATVTLSGTHFDNGATVTFNGTPSTSVTKVNGHKLSVVVPDGATTGEVDVHEGLTTLDGPKFTVQQLTSTTSSASKSTVVYGHKLLVKAHERVASSGDPVVHAVAALQHRSGAGHKWRHAKGIKAKKTGSAGRAQWHFKPKAGGQYRVYFRQSHKYTGVASSSHALKLLPRIHLRSLHTVGQFDSTQIKGSVHPHLGGTVYLQKFTNGKWQRVRHTTPTDGHFAFTISPNALGHLKYRVVRHHDKHHGVGVSRALNLQVVRRSLHIGDSGKDVLALYKRLRHLHYDVGPKSRSYGYDLLHAVTAFEKVNGLAKDGSAGPKVWKKLNHPKRTHLKYPDASSGLAVEVKIKKQVLVLSKGGKIWRILDTSTGGGYTYTGSDGTPQQAITPRGHFSIQYKLTGWHKSDLGELYYPSYFTNTGYAIHGEGNGNSGGEVPPYPASHGCVRITNNAVLRYFDDLANGTSVWIYG